MSEIGRTTKRTLSTILVGEVAVNIDCVGHGRPRTNDVGHFQHNPDQMIQVEILPKDYDGSLCLNKHEARVFARMLLAALEDY